MPRNGQGLYTLPAGNPVVAGTDIDTAWANPTMSDIATALTNSLPRDGSAPMTGQLTLTAANPTDARHATSKAYVDNFLAYATGLFVGAIVPAAGTAVPAGYLLCDGQAVSRTTYAALFAVIGVIYGAGDGSTTFNLPDLRNEFVRGRGGARAVGSKQIASIVSHTHGVTDPTHTHAATVTVNNGDAYHQHSGNTLGAGDHQHGMPAETGSGGSTTVVSRANGAAVVYPPTQTAGNHSHGLWTDFQNATHNHTASSTIAGAVTGISIVATGGTETVPQNTALDYYIKAVADAASLPAQTWKTVSNVLNTDYTNSTTRPIQVVFGGILATTVLVELVIDTIPVATAQAGSTSQKMSVSGTVPVGGTYRVNLTGASPTSPYWSELS